VTWNLLKLFSLPTIQKNQKTQVKLDEARRLALSMAILTQLRVSAERYKLAVKDYAVTNTAAEVDARLAAHIQASASVKLENELEVVRTQTRAVLGAYQRANAYANAQIAYGRLYNTLGFDAFKDDFGADSLIKLAARVKHHFKQTEKSALKMKSNLFVNPDGNPLSNQHYQFISIHIKGVNDPSLKAKMHSEVLKLLVRNNIQYTKQGIPLTFTVSKDNKLNIDTVNWSITLQNEEGLVVHSTEYRTKMPHDSRASIFKASLIAAATSNLKRVKHWLKL
jgi:hypothetical protein